MSSCTITKNGYSHLSSAITPLILIRNISIGVNSKDSIAVIVISHIRIITTREYGVAIVITILSTPVASTKRLIIREQITIVIIEWLMVCNLAELRNIIARIYISYMAKIEQFRCFLNVLCKLFGVHSGSFFGLRSREKTADLSIC